MTINASMQAAKSYARDRVVRILAGSLTPTTLAQVIADLDQVEHAAVNGDDSEQRIANQVRAAFLTQLECLVGDDDARVLVTEALEPPKATPAVPQKIMTVIPAQPQ